MVSSFFLLPSLPLPRLEMPTDLNDHLSHKNLKNRWCQQPLAEKLFNQAAHMPMLSAPDDRSITSLYVSGVDTSITEEDLRLVNVEEIS